MGILIRLYRLILKIKNKKEYESLAPVSNIKNNATLDMLVNAVADSKNYNIALSGKYGAGKSSIIKSFLKGFRKLIYKPLYISLGMLGIEDDEKRDINEFCQEIEKSIIQQIIYKEDTSKLPDSNIKRVSKLKKRNIVYIMIIAITFILIKVCSLYIENYNDEIKKLIEKFFSFNIYIQIGIIIAMFVVILLISKLIAKFLKKIDIKNIKFNFSNTEIAIEKSSAESLINKYMDELVYFFSVTKYNVVIIEDLDRFLENDEIKNRVLIIFQKLKELNQILNSSKQIKRKISFIYVVKDDLFNNEEERTKFFDEIVPVIPIISNYNSYAELKNRFEGYGIKDKIIQDISPYINDYRVIINLKNEFVLYQKEIKGNEIVKEKQLAMIVLKNMRPNEYENLLNNKGIIHDIINRKEELIGKKVDKINSYIKNNNDKIKEYRNEILINFEELKRLVLSSLYGKTSNRSFSGTLSAQQFLNSSVDYEKIKNTTIYIQDYRGYSFSESEVFGYFGGKDKFLERAKHIANASTNEIERLTLENEQYEKEKEELYKKPFYELFINNDNISISDEFIKMLLTNGYIDENYQDYMLKFKETKDMTKHDYTFISNVRQYRNTNYDYSIENVEKVIKQLNASYFGTEAILNYNVIDYLIIGDNGEIKEKQNSCIAMLTELNQNKENFILGFIKRSKNKVIFITKLHEKDDSTLYKILIKNSDKKDRVELMIKNILNIPEILNYEKTNEFIRNYIADKEDFSGWIEMNENVKKSLLILDVKFKQLAENNNDFLEFVYNNNLYMLNSKMILELFKYKGITKQEFEEKNLSIILNDTRLETMKSYVEQEKTEYINNCYLETLGTRNNIKDIIECINNWDISEENKEQIIKNMNGKIDNINDVRANYYEELIKNNKIKPTWENYYYFYCQNDNQITDELLNDIELNIVDLKKQDVIAIVMPEEDEQNFIEFRTKIVKNNKLNIDVYKQIVTISCIEIEVIEKNEIGDERLKILIENRILKLSDNNLQIVYEQVPEVVDLYINNNMESFIDSIGNYTLNENLISDIIKSPNIKFRDKNKIIDIIDISYINENSMEYIINNYSQNRISKIKEELKEKIFSSEIKTTYRLSLFEKELEKNTPVDLIDKYLRLLPSPYRKIADYENFRTVFSIPKTKTNEKIIENLKDKGFKFTKLMKKNRINIYNKK